MDLLAEVRSRFAPVLQALVDDPAPYLAMIRPAQDVRFGDFQANCAMPLQKILGRPPRDVAADLVARVRIDDLCHPPEIAGPGFVNLRLRDDRIEELTNRLVQDERLGVEPVADPRTVVVDFSGPNVAKPMHVGHLRSTVIGAALCRILSFLGHRTIGDNHIGDWGTQFGMILFGYKHFLDRAAYERDPVPELARLYRLVNQLGDYHETRAKLPGLEATCARKVDEVAKAEAEAHEKPKDKSAQAALKKLRQDLVDAQETLAAARERIERVESAPQLRALAAAHPDVAEQAREETARLHAGDPENTGLWKTFLPACLAMLQTIYDRLGIEFDETLGESAYQPLLADVVDDLLKKGIAQESDGAVCVFVEGNRAPFLVRKSDGAFTYATTDLATIRYRVEEFAADEMLYVVDSRQAEHFKLLFETARRWGYDRVAYRHVSFGSILGKDGKPYKTRSGDTVGLESLLDEAVSRAREIVESNEQEKPAPELDESERIDVADAVGLGGIKYADLHHNRESDYVFDWDKMLAKTGDTATYMQYAYARVCGIFRRGQVERTAVRADARPVRIAAPAERALALQLLRFPQALAEAAAELRPNYLTQYLFETANAFSTFFEECPVLKAEDEAVRASRLKLCDATARIVACGLDLLGIRTCERM